jgi:hypothetical protein
MFPCFQIVTTLAEVRLAIEKLNHLGDNFLPCLNIYFVIKLFCYLHACECIAAIFVV